MGAGKGRTRRAKGFIGGLLKEMQDARALLLSGQLSTPHIETRFHPREIELLDAYAERNRCVTRSEALLDALHKQFAEIEDQPVLTKQERREIASEHQKELFGTDKPTSKDVKRVRKETAQALRHSTIIKGELNDADRAIVKEYFDRTGCGTAFAVPRYALIAQLVDEGVLSSDTKPAIGFTKQPAA